MTKPENKSPFEEILTDSGFRQTQRDAAYDQFMKPAWYYLIRGCALIFLWGLALVMVWVFIEKDSPAAIAIYIIGSLVLAVFYGTGLYIFSGLIGLIPFKKYTHDQRLNFLMVVGLIASELVAIALLLFLTISTLQRIF